MSWSQLQSLEPEKFARDLNRYQHDPSTIIWTSVNLDTLSARSCRNLIHMYVKKKISMFVLGHSFVWLVSIISWLKFRKLVESLLETIAKCQNTRRIPFHPLCETVMIICLDPHRETIFCHEKRWSARKPTSADWTTLTCMCQRNSSNCTSISPKGASLVYC